MDAYFARQPILDQEQRVFGYELLFRPSSEATHSGDLPVLDGDQATAAVLETVNWRGIERATGGRPAFVNFTENLLLSDIVCMYPSACLVIEVLEYVRESPDLLQAVTRLKEQGYTIALDDFVLRHDNVRLLQMCDIVKVEVSSGGPALDNLRRVLDAVRGIPCRVLAEKVETRAEFEVARAMGCTLFQGYFFAKPATVLERIVAPKNVNLLQLVGAVNQSTINFDEITNIIRRDVGLSYKTLQLINSAQYAPRNQVSSIKQAVVGLGQNGLRRWLTAITLMRLGDNKVSELLTMSLVRARFCELMALHKHCKDELDAYFLTGLFSLLDVLTETDFSVLLDAMNVPELTRAALCGKESVCLPALQLIRALEEIDWRKVDEISGQENVRESNVFQMYHAAIEWAGPISTDDGQMNA